MVHDNYASLNTATESNNCNNSFWQQFKEFKRLSHSSTYKIKIWKNSYLSALNLNKTAVFQW